MPNNSSINQPTQPSNRPFNACPYLGLEEDPSTWLFYANPANHCFKSKPPRPIDPDHQRQFCLSKAYPLCKIYQQSFTAPLPPIAELEPKRKQRPAWVNWLLLASVVLIFIVALGLIWSRLNRAGQSQDGEVTSNTPSSILVIPTDTPQNTLTNTPVHPLGDFLLTPYASYTPYLTPTPLNSPTPSITLNPPTQPATPGPAFKTPFGPYLTYLLHKVVEGESLGSLATLYRTSIPVIRATNQLIEGAALWPDTILIILPGVTDPNLTVKLIPVFIEIPILPVDLAARYQVSVESIVAYNLLDPQAPIPTGRWLIIPAIAP